VRPRTAACAGPAAAGHRRSTGLGGYGRSVRNRCRWARSYAHCNARSAHRELGAAAVVHPDTATVPAPVAALLAGDAGNLPEQRDLMLDAGAAELPAPVLGFADQAAWRIDETAAVFGADFEIALAPTRSPYLVAAVSPAVAFAAGHARLLPQQAYRRTLQAYRTALRTAAGFAAHPAAPQPLRRIHRCRRERTELGPAAQRHPHAGAVGAPFAAAHAGVVGKLADQFNASAGIHRTVHPAQVARLATHDFGA